MKVQLFDYQHTSQLIHSSTNNAIVKTLSTKMMPASKKIMIVGFWRAKKRVWHMFLIVSTNKLGKVLQKRKMTWDYGLLLFHFQPCSEIARDTSKVFSVVIFQFAL